MILISLFLPLYSSIAIWFLPYIVYKKQALFFIVIIYIYSFCINLYNLLFIIYTKEILFFNLGSWLNCGLVKINWEFIFDSLSLSMMVMISFISGLVHLYSINYMQMDSSIIRFFSLLSLFTFFMYLLVSSNNFIVLFLGWEGIGICSYLLISFWNTKLQATKAALKAIIFNRIGDMGFLAGVGLVYYFFRTFDFEVVFVLAPYFYNVEFINIYGLSCCILEVICFLFFIGVIGKSAQIGLHGWLPEAMEGPTPVSALIHAATLVTAGVYLLIRASFLFEYSGSVQTIIAIMGSITAIMGASIAFFQSDVKKIIAFSTTSQLGYMVFCCGLSGYNIAFFHLFNHAFFKSLLFLSAGSIIHSALNDQDLRKYGGFVKMLPFTYLAMFIGVFSLSGFPYLSGFYSKEIILEHSFSNFSVEGNFVYWVGGLTAFMTSFYSFRCLYLVFFTKLSSTKVIIQGIKELPIYMAICLSFLILGSLISGFYCYDFFIGNGTYFWNNSICIFFSNLTNFDLEMLSFWIKNIPVIGSIIGFILVLSWNSIVYRKIVFSQLKTSLVISNIDFGLKIYYSYLLKFIQFLNHKWLFDIIYNYFFGFFFLKQSYLSLYRLIDKGFIEIIFVDWVYKSLFIISEFNSKKQGGYIYNGFCLITLGSFLFIVLIFLIF